MAILYQDARMLLNARLSGVSFGETLTIGHQSLSLHAQEAKALRREYRAAYPDSTIAPLTGYAFGDYADGFFRDVLQADSVGIMDYSPYEGATLIHDLNTPVPDRLKCRFDAVIDCGSLEHVFNFPTAIAGLMSMVKVGGSIFITTPANNLCGHGFYQFSPELMFRVFSEDYGFRLQRLAVVEATFPSIELSINREVYDVVDPRIARSRVMLVTKGPVVMMVHATKLRDAPLFADPPLQSDYRSRWEQGAGKVAGSRAERIARRLLDRLPVGVRARIVGHAELRRFSLANSRFYRRASK